MGPKAAQEKSFQQQVRDRANGREVLASYDTIANAVRAQTKIYKDYRLLEGGHALMSELFYTARTLLRAGDERPKPNGERLKEFGDARRESLELDLFSDKPIYADLEIVKLSDSLTLYIENAGFDDPLVQKVLAGKSPRERAAELVNNTKIRDVAFRKKLYEGGAKALTETKDPMIELARLVDPQARALRKEWEAHEETRQQAHGIIEKARFALEGPTRAPDATFTLRLSYGPVKSYEEAGKRIAPYTDFAGLYARNAEHKNKEPFDLSKRWFDKKSALNLKTAFNFVNTADIIGGNSGSPVINTAGEFVGIIFDGNLASLVLDFAYEDEHARAISVDSRAIIEAMQKVYAVDHLVKELLNGKRS
jgi:hypothetical protein